MDFIKGLPVFSNKDTILVVVDRFNKYAHFVALSHPYTAEMVAQAYHDIIYKLHGLQRSIVLIETKFFSAPFSKHCFLYKYGEP